MTPTGSVNQRYYSKSVDVIMFLDLFMGWGEHFIEIKLINQKLVLPCYPCNPCLHFFFKFFFFSKKMFLKLNFGNDQLKSNPVMFDGTLNVDASQTLLLSRSPFKSTDFFSLWFLVATDF
jgi:hypothetical protein